MQAHTVVNVDREVVVDVRQSFRYNGVPEGIGGDSVNVFDVTATVDRGREERG